MVMVKFKVRRYLFIYKRESPVWRLDFCLHRSFRRILCNQYIFVSQMPQAKYENNRILSEEILCSIQHVLYILGVFCEEERTGTPCKSVFFLLKITLFDQKSIFRGHHRVLHPKLHISASFDKN